MPRTVDEIKPELEAALAEWDALELQAEKAREKTWALQRELDTVYADAHGFTGVAYLVITRGFVEWYGERAMHSAFRVDEWLKIASIDAYYIHVIPEGRSFHFGIPIEIAKTMPKIMRETTHA